MCLSIVLRNRLKLRCVKAKVSVPQQSTRLESLQFGLHGKRAAKRRASLELERGVRSLSTASTGLCPLDSTTSNPLSALGLCLI